MKAPRGDTTDAGIEGAPKDAGVADIPAPVPLLALGVLAVALLASRRRA